MRSFTINQNDAGQRLDKFIAKSTTGMPKSLMYKFIRTKRIKVNGGRAHENDMLSAGDVVEMYISDEFFGDADAAPDYSKVKTVPDIIYEDENILLCNKKPGVLVHTGDEGDKNRADADERETLIYALTAYLVNKGDYQPDNEASFAPALCNRIDRNTGGIVILAKNAAALRAVNEAIRENRVHKTYLCAVHGKLVGEKTLRAYHRKDYKTNTVRITAEPLPGSKEIITKYKSLAYNRDHDLTLLEISLITGRTHQIRAHMAFIGHPLLGEGKYGVNRDDRKLGYSAQALYSYAVEFEFTEPELTYLNGRTYRVPDKSVKFMELFPKK
ncbi:MAG: RluA family pseudouridine synthase [Ruminococcaceae bacterium]|nr:RluA family pseudouridine synthase [Oscillospiraceae bacterium]